MEFPQDPLSTAEMVDDPSESDELEQLREVEGFADFLEVACAISYGKTIDQTLGSPPIRIQLPDYLVGSGAVHSESILLQQTVMREVVACYQWTEKHEDTGVVTGRGAVTAVYNRARKNGGGELFLSDTDGKENMRGVRSYDATPIPSDKDMERERIIRQKIIEALPYWKVQREENSKRELAMRALLPRDVTANPKYL